MKLKNFVLVALVLLTITITSCSKEEVAEEAKVDVVTTASIVATGDALVEALNANGAWLAAAVNDVTTTKDVIVDGEFVHREAVDRKLALYDQDEDHNITAQYTFTAPKMIVKSPNFRITGGTFVGDIYVEADGFWLDKSATVKGDIYFSNQAQLSAFRLDETAKHEGEAKLSVDAVTTASIVADGDALVEALTVKGNWLAAATNDVTTDKEVVVEGTYVHRDAVDRKLALYDQDEDHNITAQYTFTAPKMTVKSPNFRITGGTFAGDIYVEADGFSLDKSATVQGNIYFSTQEQLDAFTMADDAKLEGEKLLK